MAVFVTVIADPLPKSRRHVASMLPPPCQFPSHAVGRTARQGQTDLSAQDGLLENLGGIIGFNRKKSCFVANTLEQQRRFDSPNPLSLLHKRPLRVYVSGGFWFVCLSAESLLESVPGLEEVSHREL